MRKAIPLVFSLASMMAACTQAPPPDIPVAQASSSQCIDTTEWGYSARRGAVTFNSSCAYCHGRDGSGKTGQVPALAGNAALMADPERGIRMLLVTQAQDQRFHGMVYDDMIAILGEMDENDFADVLTYVLSSWGNCAGPIEPGRIEAVAASLE